MRRAPLLVLALVLALTAGASTVAAATEQDSPKLGATIQGEKADCLLSFTATEFHQWSAKVWNTGLWERKSPTKATLQVQRHKLHCAAGPQHRAAMRHTWKSDKADFYHHRRSMLFRLHVTPYYGCTKLGICGWWAIPAYIVSCESGGDYGAQNPSSSARGAYQMLDSTYATYCSACDWSKRDQDRAAHRLYASLGSGPWSCA